MLLGVLLCSLFSKISSLLNKSADCRISQNPWTAQKAKKPSILSRKMEKIHQPPCQQQGHWWLSPHLFSPCHWVGTEFNQRGEGIWLFREEHRARTTAYSSVDFHCPVVVLSSPSVPTFSSSPEAYPLIPLQPYPIFLPKRKKHETMLLLNAASFSILLACYIISFGTTFDYFYIILLFYTTHNKAVADWISPK